MILLISFNCAASESTLKKIPGVGTMLLSELVVIESTADIYKNIKFYKNLEILGEINKLNASSHSLLLSLNCSVAALNSALISLSMILPVDHMKLFKLMAPEDSDDAKLLKSMILGMLSVHFCMAGQRFLSNAINTADRTPSIVSSEVDSELLARAVENIVEQNPNIRDLEAQFNSNSEDDDTSSMTSLLSEPEID